MESSMSDAAMSHPRCLVLTVPLHRLGVAPSTKLWW